MSCHHKSFHEIFSAGNLQISLSLCAAPKYHMVNMITVPTFLSVTLTRCTIQKECAHELLQRSWISMGEGPQQCPSMTLTPPEISISADIKVKCNPCISLLSATTFNNNSNRCHCCSSSSYVCHDASVFKTDAS